MHKLTVTILIAALSFPPAFAFADANIAADIYREASEAYQQGNFKAAASLLEKAYLEDANLIYKYNQILAHMGAKNHAEALSVLNQHSDAMKADGRFDDIDDIRLQLETAVAEKEKTEQEKLAAANKVTPEPEVTTPEVVPPPTTTSRTSPNYLAWTLVGVGGLTMASSALFYSHAFISDEAQRINRYHALLDHPDPKKSTNKRFAFDTVYKEFGDKAEKLSEDDAAKMNLHNNLGTAALITGGVFVATGLALWYFDIPEGASDEPLANKKSTDSNAFKVHVTPFFSTESAGASMHLKF